MPIRFDDVAAETLAGELELTVQAVLELAARFEQEAVRTVVDWQGGFREGFDSEAVRLDRTALTLAGQLHLMAVAVRAGQFEAQAARRAEAEAAARQAQADAEARERAARAEAQQAALAAGVSPVGTTVPR